MTAADSKKRLRQRLQCLRKTISENDHARMSRAAALRFLRETEIGSGMAISLFWPLGTEIDTRPLMHALHHLGIEVLLPRTYARATPLSFHPWTPETSLQRSAFGVEEPRKDSPRRDPELLIVPLLAFDKQGFRLGYGAGHYDCTLCDLASRGLHPKTTGLAFDCQQVEEVPREPHDMPLDMIVTEAGAWRRPA